MSDELTPDQLAELRQDLATLQGELAEQHQRTAANAGIVDLDQPIGRLSRMDAMQEQQMAREQLRRLEVRQARVGSALERMDRNEYGWCSSCDEPIPWPRLKVSPEALTCVECHEGLGG